MRELYSGILNIIPKTLLQKQTDDEDEEAQNPDNISDLPQKIKLARLYSLFF